MTHELKTLPVYFERILAGDKTFETRDHYAGFQKGDEVPLDEYDPSIDSTMGMHKFTGRQIQAEIGYVLSEFQKEGYVTFSLLNITTNQ